MAANKYTSIAQQVWDETKTREAQQAAHKAQVEGQQAKIAADPTLGTKMSNEEMSTYYADIMNGTLSGQTGGEVWSKGGYTKDKSAADAAAAAGATVTEAKKPGTSEEGWYHYTGTRQADPTYGGGGADHDLMTDEDYAAVQYEKERYASAQTSYQAALAAGNTEEAAQWKEVMDEANRNAERIRLRYGYQGGADGSQYLTAGELGIDTGRGTPQLRAGTDAMRAEAQAAGFGGGGYGSGGYGSGGSGESSSLWGSSSGGGGDDLSEYLKQMYGATTDAALAELEAAYKKNMAELDRAEAGLEKSFQNARNQTAGASELAQRNFNEYAVAHGLNTGTGGQAELARNVTLQNDLNTINTEEANAFADLDLARANAETEYNLAIAQAEASGDYELAAALYQEKVRVQEMLAAQQESLLAQQSQQQSQLAAYGEQYLNSGIMPSAEMLAAMGLTEADAQAYLSAMTAASVVSNSGTGSGGGGSSKTSADYTGLFSAALASGFPQSYIANNYKKYGFTSGTGLYNEYKGWAEKQEVNANIHSTASTVADIERMIANGADDAEVAKEMYATGLITYEEYMQMLSELRAG